MKNKITIIVLSLVMLISTSTSYACNFQLAQFGDHKEKIVFNPEAPQPLAFPDKFGGESVTIPIETLCKNDKALHGTLVIYLYVENKLSQVQLYRPNMKDTNLMNFAMKKYGKFNLPEGMPKLKWRGNYQWEKSNEIIRYTATNIHDGHVEILEIHNKLYSKNLADYNEKLGKWLDSRK